MSALRQALADYLAVRRTLGFKLCDSERLLTQFITYLENRGEEHVTIEAAVAWATLPAQGHRRWLSARLTVVRRFAFYLRGLDPSTQIPPTDLLPGQKLRATPYLYSGKEISALMNLSKTLLGSYRQATYRTLIGLLAVTGMRIGETIALDVDDLNIENGVLTVRVGKFGKSRALPLHPSTVTALGDYLCSSDRPSRPANRLCSSPRSAPGCNMGVSTEPSGHLYGAPALRRVQRYVDRGCTTFDTDLPSIPFSTDTKATMSIPVPASRCCRPISGTQTLPIPIGISRPLRSF